MTGEEQKRQSGGFEKLFFRRDGGGNKAFYVSADESGERLLFNVVKYNFKETSYSFDHASGGNDKTCRLVSAILSGKHSVAGSAELPAKPTGTWVHLYAVTAEDALVEITDRNVLDQLMVLERYVEAQHAGSGSER